MGWLGIGAGVATLALMVYLVKGATALTQGASVPFWGWFWMAVIAGGMASVGFGIGSARAAGGTANQAAALADTINQRYGQKDQSAALRTCLRLALKGQDCEGGDEKDGKKDGKRAEACGYREDRCMTSEELNAFSKCMRGDNL